MKSKHVRGHDRNISPLLRRGSLGLFASLCLTTFTATSAVARPGHAPTDRGERCLPAHIRRALPIFDSNKNGRLDPEEHQAMRAAERKADLATYDANGDGTLDNVEHANLQRGKLISHFEDLDTDKNAEISAQEATGSCTPVEHHFSRIDTDGNGTITWAEFEAAAPKGPAGQRPPRARR